MTHKEKHDKVLIFWYRHGCHVEYTDKGVLDPNKPAASTVFLEPQDYTTLMELKKLEDDKNRETFDDSDERCYVKDNEKNDKVDYERILMGVVEKYPRSE